MKKTLLVSLLFALLTMAAFAGGKTYSYTYELQRGWNLIGVFLAPSYDTQAQLEAYQLYEYSRQGTSGAFRRASEITAGKAYWIYWEGDSESLTIEGTMMEGIVKKDVPTDPEGAYDLTETVFAGNEITRTAPEVDGYEFTGWTATGVILSDGSAQTISFAMPSNDMTLSPNYEKSGGGTGGTYLVVNLSDGSYRYTETAPDLSSDTCRTTELWLRRIPAGTFTMGSPTDELGRDDNETQHQVTLSEDFYIGVFEMTQKQYELIYGSNPSYYTGDTRPVECVSYNTIRGSSTGARWPSSYDVGRRSFLWKLRAWTGLVFDLPTEAQWEYACRAGTTTALNTGKDLTNMDEDGYVYQDSAMDEAGRYAYNNYDGKGGYSEHTKVGSYLPNVYGLYDMHGNVEEWCLDWFQDDLGSAAATDPVGASSGSRRVVRGGGCNHLAQGGRSASRGGSSPSNSYNYSLGFRVAFVPSVQEDSYVLTVDGVEETVCRGTVVSKTAPTKEGYTFTGWTVEGVTVEDASANPLSFTMPDNNVTLTPNYLEVSTLYLVVNLETGSYHYSGNAPDLSSDTCRTTELWLRRIPAGTFTMGSPEYEEGRDDDETQHQVTLSEDFYIGVFEITQRQYELIYGSNPSSYTGDTRPVEEVSYSDIRGSSKGECWPSSHEVDRRSFLGKLRAWTGLVFDLPTEAQWEYACRAGTTTALNTGKDLTGTRQDSAMDEAGRYYYNSSCRTSDGKGGYDEHTQVGSYLPNNWGLYDMHGNVDEWCLDWEQIDLGSATATDPVGPTSGSARMIRGGSWSNGALYCRSAFRNYGSPYSSDNNDGFRVVLLP